MPTSVEDWYMNGVLGDNAVSGTEMVERSEMDYDALLINGHPVHIAPAQLADLGRVRLFYQDLSNASTYYRFFGIRRAIPERELLNIVDPHVEEHVTVLATIQGELPESASSSSTNRKRKPKSPSRWQMIITMRASQPFFWRLSSLSPVGA